MTRRFTGWHMAAIMIAFFGVVITVNIVMARDAIRTFGGEVVENSYVASQRYNRWLAEARVQEQAGWHAAPMVGANDVLHLELSRAGAKVSDAEVEVTAHHPLGQLPDQHLRLHAAGAGLYRADKPLPAGRWLLKIEVRRGGEDARFDDEVRL